MLALTVCQPYASLIALPDDDDSKKRVENRTWKTNYRGLIAIHAGKSRSWLQEPPPADMPFGAVVAVATLADCVRIHQSQIGRATSVQISEQALRRWPWLRHDIHASGPWGWIFTEVRAVQPVACAGRQGLFELPEEITNQVLQQLQETEAQ